LCVSQSRSGRVLYDSANNTSVTDGVATVSETAHGLSVGDTIQVVDDGGSTVFTDNTQYVIATVPDANSFTFYASVDDQASTSIAYMKPQSVGLGFSHMPSPPWAIYHQKRLVMPFNYTTTGTSGSPTITYRDVRDELIISDILDSDTYDQIVNQFRFNAGSADYIVGALSFSDDKLVVFNRSSIHLVINTIDLAESQVQLLTDEIGCIARKSIQQVGNNILFLSDNGIYGVSFQDLYNLRGNQVPLSEPIEPQILRINKEYASKSVSAYYDNRYYIAVPLDDNQKNNAILVYNFLNSSWESVDTVNDPDWEVTNFIVS
jgi:hypothetical protein